MRTLVILPFIGLLALTSACGESASEPDPPPPEGLDVSGTWAYSATDLEGGGESCDFNGVTLTLEQSGTTLSGTATGGTFSCESGLEGVQEYDTVTGSVTDPTIRFDFGSAAFSNEGTVSGSTMSGTTEVRLAPEGGDELLLTGSFSATKQ